MVQYAFAIAPYEVPLTALNVSSHELLGIKPVETTPISSRLERRIRQIEKLGPKPRQQITQLIDTFVEAEQLKKKANAS